MEVGKIGYNLPPSPCPCKRINMAAALSKRGCGPGCRNRRTSEALILTQASASMVAQANSQNDIALMLLS